MKDAKTTVVLERFAKYICEVAVRPTYKELGTLPHIQGISGHVLLLEVMWLMHSSDKYPGEYVLGPGSKEAIEIFAKYKLGWVASGDVRIIKRIKIPERINVINTEEQN